MQKIIAFIIWLTSIVSCNNPVTNNPSSVETNALQNAGEASLQQDTSVPFIDSSILGTPEPRKGNKHLPPGMFETYPQIINFLFANGSSMHEVINILGRPEYTEDKTEQQPNTTRWNRMETWYYGAMEINFKNGYVDHVSNYAGNEHCLYNYNVEVADLLISDNYIEKKWAMHLIENSTKADNPYGLK